jgi:hypothetical protein
MRQLLAAEIAFLVLCGCQAMSGISGKYPQYYPDVLDSKSLTCDISGTYMTEGICSYITVCESLSLFERLSGMREKVADGRSITITQVSANEMEMSVKTTQGVVTKHLSSVKNDFTCENGVIWIKQGGLFHAEGVGVANRKYVMGFAKAVDGSLIGEHRNSGWGLLMWAVPIAGTQTLWYKWDPAESEPRKAISRGSDGGVAPVSTGHP